MARRGRESGRVKIRWIIDNNKRNTTLKRRLPLLVKKARELAALCDVPVCLVAYPPGEAKPVVWPSPAAARDVVRQYRDLAHRLRDELDSADYLKQMNDKARAQLCKVQLQRDEAEIKTVIVDYLSGHRRNFDDLPTGFLISLGLTVQDKLHAIYARLQQIRSGTALPPACFQFQDDVKMVEPLGMMQPLLPLPMNPFMLLATPPPQHGGPASMTLAGEPRHGSYFFEVLDALNHTGDGSALPSIEELYAVFLQAGIFSPPLPNPSFFHP